MAAKTKATDLRSLMKEQLNKSKKKITSPLAKYNNAGQLFCVLCNAVLKSDLLWDAHIRGTKHKENLLLLKSGKVKEKPVLETKKGKNEEFVKPINPPLHHKRKIEESSVSSASNEIPIIKKSKASQDKSPRIPSDFFDKMEDEQEMVIDQETDHNQPISSTSEKSSLPSDFFDNSGTETNEESGESLSNEELPDKSIPEGFFDDPKQDAKARKIEYKDPGDEEWEKFQKALSTENQVSEAIIVEEEEESRVERVFDEISEQRLYYMRADVLRDKQAVYKSIKVEKQVEEDAESKMKEESDSDSDDLDEMFNWRAKKAL